MAVPMETLGFAPDGTPLELHLLTNDNGLEITVTNFGATVVSVLLPGDDGPAPVALGFDSLEAYMGSHPYLGSTVGRFANRIAGGTFELDGQRYQLACNEKGVNHLHGGELGFSHMPWRPDRPTIGGRDVSRMTYVSADGEEGYPGNLSAEVVFSLDDNNEFRIDYRATCDKPTPVNLTNHTYWNFADGGASPVLGHEVAIRSDAYLEVDENLIPTGAIVAVDGGPMDFRTMHRIGSRIKELPGGYDHCYVLRRSKPGLAPAARVLDPISGRGMEIQTTEPALQFYTGNFLDGMTGTGGTLYQQHHGLCLEAQRYPDSPNRPKFPDAILRPGEVYSQTTVHRFFW